MKDLHYNLLLTDELKLSQLETPSEQGFLVRWQNIRTEVSGTWRINQVGETDTYILKTGERLLTAEFCHCGTLAECINYVVNHYRKKIDQSRPEPND